MDFYCRCYVTRNDLYSRWGTFANYRAEYHTREEEGGSVGRWWRPRRWRHPFSSYIQFMSFGAKLLVFISTQVAFEMEIGKSNFANLATIDKWQYIRMVSTFTGLETDGDWEFSATSAYWQGRFYSICGRNGITFPIKTENAHLSSSQSLSWVVGSRPSMWWC